MPLAPGLRLGAYEVLSPLGAGGMGEVCRARDTKLNRDVALKVLPAAFAQDPERLARFKREAQVLASLNHPNIAAIYGFEESGPSTEAAHPPLQALVLELVEGPTLADRLARSSMPLAETLPLARQIAEALEAAHEQGIVHRDLKPANIKVRPDGTVKVLDFGLAKMLETGAGGASRAGGSGEVDLTASPTITSPAHIHLGYREAGTIAGTILGTAAYMSPEQAKGLPADRRSDVWAFGCVLYEMLTGRRTFEGDSVGEVVGAVFKSEPDWALLPDETPESVRRLLRRCLQKDHRLRLQSIGDARIELMEALRESSPAPAAATPARFRSRLAWTVAALLALVALGEAVWLRRAPSTLSPEVRLEVATPTSTDPISLAMSPDGSKLVFVAPVDGRPRLWLRALDSVSPQALAGTDDAFFPFWSPDSRSIGFFAGGRMNRIDLDSGLVRSLANAPNPLGGAWSRDDTILFTPNFTGAIFRVAPTGGEPAPVTRLEPGQASHRFPQPLPGGKRFLYYAIGPKETGSAFVGQLEGGAGSRLVDADAPAVYSRERMLLVRQGTLFVQDFDPVTLALRGSPMPMAEHISLDAVAGLAALSSSASGTIVYRSGPAGAERRFVWLDRSGAEVGRVGESDRMVSALSMSADGRRLCINRLVNGNMDLWLLDVVRGVSSRLTFDPGEEAIAVWSRDGSRVVFNSNRMGVYDLYVKSVDDPKPEELILKTDQNKAPVDWSRDGRYVLYRSPGKTTGFDLWALPMDGDRKPFPVVQTNFEERDGQFSPDGKWIAYQSNESGRVEIYVQPFPTGRRELISNGGGAQARWRPDGKELFYIALDGRLMAVPIRLDTAGRAFEAGVPVPLFATHVGGAIQVTTEQQYAVSPDGRRFLMSTIAETRTPPITVVLNGKPSANR
jgi:eukaryotic-like serine/threonine-protein kinase